MMEWTCQVCNFVHDGEEPPSTCPLCGAPASRFVEHYDDNEILPGGERRYQTDDDENDFYGEFE